MGQYHLKRKISPNTWPITRKKTAFVTRPFPKGREMSLTMPAVVVLRDALGLVETAKQARAIMRNEEVKVNGTRIYSNSAAVAFMDVLSIGKDNYRILINKNSVLIVVPTAEDFTVQRIRGKTSLKGGKIQLNCEGGFNIIVEKDTYRTGDGIMVNLDGELKDHYPLQKDACVFVTGGSHIAKTGTIQDIDEQSRTVTIKTESGDIETALRYAYVIGTKKPAISLE